MLTGRSGKPDIEFPTQRSLIAIISLAGLLSLFLVSANICPADSEYDKLLGYVLPSSESITSYISDGKHQNNPVIAIDNSYYDSDWDIKNLIYSLNDCCEYNSNFFVTFYIEPENSFNYTSYYGFPPLRSPPLV